MLYRYRLYLKDGSETGEAHYAARIKAAAPALCCRSDGRRVGRVADDDVVFSFRVHLTEPPTQVRVPPLDAIEILDWAAENSGDLMELHRRLARARLPDADDRVVVVSEPVRFELLRILIEIEIDHPLSPAQAELRRVAGSALIVGD